MSENLEKKAPNEDPGKNNGHVTNCFDEYHPPRRPEHQDGRRRNDKYRCFDEYRPSDQEASGKKHHHHRKAPKGHTARKLLRGTAYVFFALTLICALMGSFLAHYLLDIEGLKRAALTDEFDQATVDAVKTAVKNTATVAELDPDTIVAGLGEIYLIQYEHEYTVSFLESVLNASGFRFEPYAAAGLEQAVVNSLGPAAEGVGEETKQGLADYTRANIRSTLEYIPSVLAEYIQRFAQKMPVLTTFISMRLFFYVAAASILAIVLATQAKRHWRDILLGCTGSFWLAATAVLTPLVIILIYNVPEHLILSRQTLYYLFKGLCRALVSNGTVFFTIVWVLALAAFLTALSIRVKAHIRHARYYHHGTFRASFEGSNDTIRMEKCEK